MALAHANADCDRDLVRSIAAGGRALVALSGGVDSAVVAWVAYRALGPDAFAVTVTGPAVAQAEVDAARTSALEVGIAHRFVTVDPLDSSEYSMNPSNRCYFCRRGEATVLRALGGTLEVRQYLDGVHRDDLGDDRPGLRAMDEAGFRHPLLEAGWTKREVRQLARSVGLSVADRPSNACLASRIRHGTPISRPLLETIEAAETAVSARGFRRVRVRYDGDRARVEVGADEVARLLSEPTSTDVRTALASLGLREVVLDQTGYPARAGA